MRKLLNFILLNLQCVLRASRKEIGVLDKQNNLYIISISSLFALIHKVTDLPIHQSKDRHLCVRIFSESRDKAFI